jgi:hypothetical protein
VSVTANNRDIACESSGHQVVYQAPSVCITPAAPSPIPVPYPIVTPDGTAEVDDDTRNTRIGDKPIFCVGSLIHYCTGNEPGTQKEIVSHQTGSKMYPMVGSPNVKAEGSPVVFTGSQGMGNKM